MNQGLFIYTPPQSSGVLLKGTGRCDWESPAPRASGFRDIPLFATTPCRPSPTTTEDDGGPQQEAKVVPAAVVMDFVDVHRLGEEGNQEGEGGDEAMPQPLPKSGNLPLIVRDVGEFIGIGGASGNGKRHNGNHEHDEQFFHFSSS